MYNLADIIKYRNYGRSFKRFEPTTIAYQYLSQVDLPYHKKYGPDGKLHKYNPHEIDFDLLFNITNNRKFKRLPMDVFAIHLRLGDVIDYAPPYTAFLDIIDKYKLHKKYKKCIIFWGLHVKARRPASEKYIHKLTTGLKSTYNITTTICSGTVDNDFCQLATAQCYIAGYKGFGWLSASINPNNVIWDIQQPPIFPWEGDHDNNCNRSSELINILNSGYTYHQSIKT